MFDPRTGVFSPDESTIRPDMLDHDVDEDPCTCPAVDYPHNHSPYAYVDWVDQLQAYAYVGG